jgi:hypothetical protein
MRSQFELVDLRGKCAAQECRSWCGCTLNFSPEAIPARSTILAKPAGVKGVAVLAGEDHRTGLLGPQCIQSPQVSLLRGL